MMFTTRNMTDDIGEKGFDDAGKAFGFELVVTDLTGFTTAPGETEREEKEKEEGNQTKRKNERERVRTKTKVWGSSCGERWKRIVGFVSAGVCSRFLPAVNNTVSRHRHAVIPSDRDRLHFLSLENQSRIPDITLASMSQLSKSTCTHTEHVSSICQDAHMSLSTRDLFHRIFQWYTSRCIHDIRISFTIQTLTKPPQIHFTLLRHRRCHRRTAINRLHSLRRQRQACEQTRAQLVQAVSVP